MEENMKKRGFVALFLVICISLIFVSCSAEPTSGKGSLTSLTVETPGVLAYKEAKRVALVDHTYTVNNYKVYANYSTGYREDVTQVAKITTNDSFVEIGNDKSIKFKQKEEGNSYSLTVQYGTITLPVTAWAYVPGEPIDGLRVNRNVFYKGELLSASFAGISELDENGNYFSSSMLPSSAIILFTSGEGNNEKLYAMETLSDKYIFTEEESAMYYVIGFTAEGDIIATEVNNFKVINYEVKDIEKVNFGLLKDYPKAGDPIPTTEDDFIKKYLTSQKIKVTLKNGESFYRLLVNDKGVFVANDLGSITFSVIDSDGNKKTDGNFSKKDSLEVSIGLDSEHPFGSRKYNIY